MELLSMFYLLAFLQSYIVLISVIICYAFHITSNYDIEQVLNSTSSCISALIIPCLLLCFVWGPMFVVEMWIRDIEKFQINAFE